MTTVILFILCVWLAYYLARWFFRSALPRIVMWSLNRHIRKKYGQAYDPYGQQRSGQRQQRQRKEQRQRRGFWGSGSQQSQPRRRRRGKIIPRDVGEYVEFEDIPTYNEPSSQTQAQKPPTHDPKYKDEPQVSDADWEDIK